VCYPCTVKHEVLKGHGWGFVLVFFAVLFTTLVLLHINDAILGCIDYVHSTIYTCVMFNWHHFLILSLDRQVVQFIRDRPILVYVRQAVFENQTNSEFAVCSSFEDAPGQVH
jgi:hypothetical protein